MLKSLKAIRPVIDVVRMLIKPALSIATCKTENIFVAQDGRLVLGDFGIVLFQSGDRLTSTYERVGTRYWIAPWADRKQRLAEPTPALDVFPLAKVLWSMISGRREVFPYWEYDRDEDNLEAMFPDDASAARANVILSKCLVREERECLSSAVGLLIIVDDLIKELEMNGKKPSSGRWACGACGREFYSEKGTVTLPVFSAGIGGIPTEMIVYGKRQSKPSVPRTNLMMK